MQPRTRFLLAIGAGVLACLPMQAQMNGHGAAAQAMNDPSRNGMQTDQGADATFLKNTANANMSEVAAAQMAQSKSQNDDVKNFAQHMIDDHTAMEKDVESAASGLKVTLPTSPSKSDQKDAKKLEALDGAAFDKAYMDAQVKGHKKVLAEMKHESSTTQNAQLRDMASKGSEKVADHLKMAEDVQAKLGK
jgi:putative membrane protein